MFLPTNITLQFGDSGDYVAELQRRLVSGSGGGKGLITGFYDGMTVNAVSAFQSRSGIRADGIAGPETLRRLSGVVSGDDSATGSGSASSDEENARQAAFQREALLAAEAPHPLSPEALYAMPAAEPGRDAAPAPVPPLAEPMAIPREPDLQQAPRDVAREMLVQPHQPAAPTPGDLLAQMLLNAAPSPQSQAETAASPRHAAEERPSLAARPPLAAPPPPVAEPAAPKAEAAPVKEPAADKAPEKPSLVQRGLQMASGMMQKLADYFEAKLPDSVLKEVQQAGTAMVRAGVKEIAIPTGPELAPRSPELPGRDQQPAPARHA